MSTPDSGYFEQVVACLRADDAVRRMGFREQDINYWGKGANHAGVMVISKTNWTVHSPLGQLAMYEGVNVHFEAERPGSLNLHCELTPRLGSESKADQKIIAPLLSMKGQLTELLREACLPRLTRFGANLKRLCGEGAASPKSLKVMGFELGLPAAHSPEDYARMLQSVLSVASHVIERVIGEVSSREVSDAQTPAGPAMLGVVPTPTASDPLPIRDQSILGRIRAVRGLPERNVEDVVKRLLLALGHSEDCVHFQVGRMDVCVQEPGSTPQMVVEVKRELGPMILPDAVEQAFGYAGKVNARLVVVTDADRYEVYDRSRGGDRTRMFAGRFQLTQYRREDDGVLDLLRPETRTCPDCEEPTPGRGRYCRNCGQGLW